MPVGLPPAPAIPLTVFTSQIALCKAVRAQQLLRIPKESWSPPVLRRAWLHASRLARPAGWQAA
jgi:membrane glycosyltransferase